MKNATALKADVSSISIDQLKDYLIGVGWQRVRDFKGKASIWEKNEDQEILVPDTLNISDYFSRIADILLLLEEIEKRPLSLIIRDIKVSSFDITRIRTNSSQTQDGTIEIDDAVKLFVNAREMMLSAALSSWKPLAFFKNKPPKKVIDFLKKVRLGQTEKGSYVITILTHLAKEEGNLEFDIPQEKYLFERTVLENLNTSLKKIQSIIREDVDIRNPKVLYDAYTSGVSANLCHSILNMYEASNGGELEISFKLSRKLYTEADKESIIVFTAQQIPKLRETFDVLNADSSEEKTTLTGLVTGLIRPEGSETGRVILATIVDGRGRNVSLTLTYIKYLEAVKAHENDHLVKVKGNLTRMKNNYTFDLVESFEVLSNNLFN